MVKLEENQNTELTQSLDANDNIVLNVKINNNIEDCNVITFQFQNSDTFQECLSLFKERRILSIVDKERNIELNFGCTEGGSDEYIYFEILDYNRENMSNSASYLLTIYKNDTEYAVVKKIFELIEREKEEQKSNERKLDNVKY